MKRERWYFGYKNHIKVDAGTKLIVADVVTDASVHDRKMLPILLSDDDVGCEVYADKGYAGVGPKAEVVAVKTIPRIMHKGKRNKAVSAEQKAENKQWARIRSRIVRETPGRTARPAKTAGEAIDIGRAAGRRAEIKRQKYNLSAQFSFNTRPCCASRGFERCPACP